MRARRTFLLDQKAGGRRRSTAGRDAAALSVVRGEGRSELVGDLNDLPHKFLDQQAMKLRRLLDPSTPAQYATHDSA
jgi:hypothetical protein